MAASGRHAPDRFTASIPYNAVAIDRDLLFSLGFDEAIGK